MQISLGQRLARSTRPSGRVRIETDKIVGEFGADKR